MIFIELLNQAVAASFTETGNRQYDNMLASVSMCWTEDWDKFQSCWGARAPVGVIISSTFRHSLPSTASFFFSSSTCSRSTDVSCILMRNRPPVFFETTRARAMIVLWSYESRGADCNVVNLAGSAQLAQKEHSGPGGVSESVAEGWRRPVQTHGAAHTWTRSQGELWI